MLDLSGKTLYFISDLHLGARGVLNSREREKLAVKWLHEVSAPNSVIFLLGDIFDFWYEWKHVAPRGFTRFLGAIGQLTDKGIPVHFFTGNHDLWVWNYLPQETGMHIHKHPLTVWHGNKKLYIAHGDGLGPYDRKYNLLKKVFTNPVIQWLFSRLHPNFAIGLAKMWSGHSRQNNSTPKFLGANKEFLIRHSQDIEANGHHDFYVYGHRHMPGKYRLNSHSAYLNTGDWTQHFTYAVFNGNGFTLYSYFPKHVPLSNPYIDANSGNT